MEGRDGCGAFMPALFSILGKIEESLEWLEHALELGFIDYPMLAHLDLFLENLRLDPRSRDVMGRIKNAWEQFEI